MTIESNAIEPVGNHNARELFGLAFIRRWTVVRVLLVGVLLTTAMLKVIHSAAMLTADGLLNSPTAISLVVAFELFSAGIIMMGPRKIAQWFALILFSCFFVVATGAWITHKDCGCFGSDAPKGLPVLVDVIAVLLVISVLRRERDLIDLTKKTLVTLRVSFVVALILAVLGGALTRRKIDHQSSIDAMPAWFGEALIGSEFPLFQDERFATRVPEVGDAIIVFLRPDCSHCRELVQRWPAISQGIPPSMDVIGISMSPKLWTVTPGHVLAASLAAPDEFSLIWINDDEPFVASPSLFAVRDRIVLGIDNGENVNHLMDITALLNEMDTESSVRRADNDPARL